MSSSSGESPAGGVNAHGSFFVSDSHAIPCALRLPPEEQLFPDGAGASKDADVIKLEGWRSVDVKGDGSCFFHCVALGTGVSVQEQRELVSDNLTSDHFALYKDLYANTKRTLDEEKKKRTPRMDLVKELDTQMREYGFIKDCQSLEDLEKMALGPRYWADQTAIEIIQMKLNIAFLRNPDLEGSIYIFRFLILCSPYVSY